MRLFKTRWFARYARRERLADDSLSEAVERAERGLIDADLGGGLIKQRVARPGQGKSGGYRTILAYRVGQSAVFLFGFAKSQMDNIDPEQVRHFRDMAADILAADQDWIEDAIDDDRLEEIEHGKKFGG